eukprot:3950077-Ditylum_brightwellii.AAC.1
MDGAKPPASRRIRPCCPGFSEVDAPDMLCNLSFEISQMASLTVTKGKRSGLLPCVLVGIIGAGAEFFVANKNSRGRFCGSP